MAILIEHTHAEGTLLHGSTKGDGVLELVKPHGFRSFPTIQAIGIRNSRDRLARRHAIEAAAETLRQAGHEVEVRIDDTPRDRDTVRADQAQRLDARREALESKADRLHAKAEAHYEAADRIAKARPLGQPILIGHHSERRARADQRRIERNMDAFCATNAQAREAQRRAGTVGSNAQHSATAGATARRIERNEAELRKVQRYLDGYTDRWGSKFESATGARREALQARKAFLEHQLTDDRAALVQAAEDGRRPLWSKANVHVGDHVYRVGWRKVVRVNKVSVSVETGYTWTDTVRYSEIGDVRCPHTPQPDAGAQP